MTELLRGWAEARLDDLAEVRLGRQRSPKNHSGTRMRPYLRAANVTWSGLDLRDVKEMNFTEDESAVYELRAGDVLVAEASGSADEVGKPAVWRGDIDGCCFQNTLIRVRTLGPLPEYLRYFLLAEAQSGRIGRASPGVGIHHIGAARLAAWRVPVAPLGEQRRIVEAIEEQHSRLDAADASLAIAFRRLEVLRRSTLASAMDGGWIRQRLGEVANTQLGKMLSRKSRTGVGSRPYLRNKNVQWGRIDTDDLLTMDFSESEAEKFGLLPGDVLVCEGGEVGRAAVWRGQVDGCCFQKALHRVRSDGEVLPEFIAHVFRWLSDTNAFDPYVTGSTIRHLPQEDLRVIPIPVPPLHEQRRIVAELEERLSVINALGATIERAKRRSAVMRTAVLARAFRGELVPQNPDDEPAAVLLERIAAERAAAPTPSRKRRARSPA
jgi:type I restriction enzyme, S subunit